MKKRIIYPDWVYCKICENPFKQITNDHLRYKHDITMKEYREEYPNAILKSKSAVAFLGEKRPEHAKKLRKKRIKKVCKGCNESFEVLPYQEYRIFCSSLCHVNNCNPMNNPISIVRLSNSQKKRLKNKKLREHNREVQRKVWSNPEYKFKQLKKIFEGFKLRPTSLERILIKIIEKYKLPYDYVGDGKVFIAGKVPDFIDAKNKVLVEVCGNYWHTEEEMKGKAELFSKYGFNTIVIWEDELKELPEIEIVNILKGA